MKKTNDKTSVILDTVIDYLKESGQESLLPQVARDLEEVAQTSGVPTEIFVRSAAKLSDKQQKELSTFVEKKFGYDLPVHVEVDPALIGGFTVRVGDWLYDASIKTDLEELKQTLLT